MVVLARERPAVAEERGEGARPPEARPALERSRKKTVDRESQDQMILSLVMKTLRDTSQRERDKKLRALQARTFGFGVVQQESLAVANQNLATLRQLLALRNGATTLPYSPFRQAERDYELGQWVDVKDTIDQWLEAEVIDKQGPQVLVHYNGWGARWDEWLPCDSPRVSFFRSRTV